jgi:hypothetical protein
VALISGLVFKQFAVGIAFPNQYLTHNSFSIVVHCLYYNRSAN